ncbi:serine hydrolase domain-containing protein [Flavobacterium poyangense]|uniref:serine hydrolase domain-containing protein n=1 Tax=Flavobacterium poyangense TaxID=2204302 RepID=UPI00141F52C6|nr:serine hydrolase domain-containing protein [Flavobacterium sp. JXAS1]
MKKSLFIASFFAFLNCCFSQSVTIDAKETAQKIDTYLKEVIQVNEIPGAALAVIKNGKVIYEKYYGKASLEEHKPVDKNTGFKIFSTTKLITNVGVFQLIENKKLSLDDSISKYLNNIPKEWQGIKVAHLLSHSSGLPNIIAFNDIPITLPYEKRIEILATKPMEFATGARYRYNQTNYLFLAKIIEKITGLTFDEYILKNQFAAVKSGVSFLSDTAGALPADGIRYTYNPETKKYENKPMNFGIDSHSANGLVITLPEFIRWNENLDNNTFMRSDTKYAMWEPFQYANDTRAFTYGWEVVSLNKIPSYGFTGGNETAFRKFIKNDMTIIFLSNGHKYLDLYVQSQVVDHVAGIVDKTLVDAYSLAAEKINYDFLRLDIKKSKQNYLTTKKTHPDWNFEYRLNEIAYTLMNYGRLNDAIKIFELNAKENPKSGNAFDSLAESYYKNNQLQLAKQNYEKSVVLSPENTNAKEMLEKIKLLIAKQKP